MRQGLEARLAPGAGQHPARDRERLVDRRALLRLHLCAEREPGLVLGLARAGRRTDRDLERSNRVRSRLFHPPRLRLAARDGEDSQRGRNPNPSCLNRSAKQRAGTEVSAETRQVERRALADAEDLTRVVREMVPQPREAVAPPERIEPFADGQVEPTARPRRPGEELLASVRLRLAALEELVELAGRVGRPVELRWHVPRAVLGGGLGGHRDQGGRGAHRTQRRTPV